MTTDHEYLLNCLTETGILTFILIEETAFKV